MSQYVFVYGDPVNGFEFIGPLDTTEDTDLEGRFQNKDWWYGDLESRAEAMWQPGMPDPEEEEEDPLWRKFNDLVCDGDDLFDETGRLLPGNDLSALLALRDIVMAWRAIPYPEDD